MESATQLGNFWILLPLVAIVFIVATGVLVLNLHFQKNIYKQRVIREEMILTHQKELLRSSIMAQEDERKRIAADLHDELGAILSISRMHLVALENQTPENSTEHIDALKNVRELTETSISTVRRISHELMPQHLKTFGLIQTLEQIATRINNSNDIEIRLDCKGNPDNLSWDINLGVYRICLELINNTIKHAHAKHIQITIGIDANGFTMFYADDGIGISEEKLKHGLGLKNIEARAISIGATIGSGNNENGGYYTMMKISRNI